ncbi:hypothetical protein FFF34_008160 [Inquilinus sp. KBS0705]|nr:hypothetical protein FFF34_008160 [Inquilinus sp. KBS0705]
METKYTSQPETPISVKPLQAEQQPHHLTPADYIIEALGEGIKQNFLGYSIDMEFLTLTARSIVVSGVSSIKQHVIKPISAKLQRGHGHPNLTQTSF